MCEQYQVGIEHVNQEGLLLSPDEAYLDAAHKDALLERYRGLTPIPIKMHELFPAIELATRRNLVHRKGHEDYNLTLLGIPASSELKQEYDSYTGRADKVGHFIEWFSRISHLAYVAQEHLPEAQRFKHVSLELGGIFQLGDWEADDRVERMAKSIPERLLQALPSARLDVYGQKWMDQINDSRVTYKDIEPHRYTLFPQYLSHIDQPATESVGRVAFNYTVVRRRTPLADIYTDDDHSDLVIFGERLGIMVMPMVEEKVREAIIEDCQQEFEKGRGEKRAITLQDTLGARMAGKLFEIALRTPLSVTKDMIPVSAHYVQGVGVKFAGLREDFSH